MVTKSNDKVMDTLTFNKANAQAFGNSIYQDDKSVVSFLKLCDGTLQGKVGGKTLHCAIGEAYFTFVSTNMKSVLSISKKQENSDDSGDVAPVYVSKYGVKNEDPGTTAAIDALVDEANLRSQSSASKRRLAKALEECVNINDNVGSSDCNVGEFADRAKAVASIWNKRVVPLLK